MFSHMAIGIDLNNFFESYKKRNNYFYRFLLNTRAQRARAMPVSTVIS